MYLHEDGEMPAQAAKQSTLLPFIQHHATLIVIESSLLLAIGLLPPVIVMILMILLPAGFLLVPLGALHWCDSALGRGDYDTGLRRLALLKRSGLQPQANLLKGLALAQAGRFDEARTLYEEDLLTVKSLFEQRIWLDGLARVYRGLGDLEKAQELLEQSDALSLRPFPPTCAKLAMVMLERNVTPEKALAYSEKALAAQESMGFLVKVFYFLVKSEPAKRHLLRAWALTLLGRNGEAEAAIQKATPAMNSLVKSDYAEQCYLLARVLIAQRKPREAKDYLHKAVDADPVGGTGLIAKRLLSHT